MKKKVDTKRNLNVKAGGRTLLMMVKEEGSPVRVHLSLACGMLGGGGQVHEHTYQEKGDENKTAWQRSKKNAEPSMSCIHRGEWACRVQESYT